MIPEPRDRNALHIYRQIDAHQAQTPRIDLEQLHKNIGHILEGLFPGINNLNLVSWPTESEVQMDYSIDVKMLPTVTHIFVKARGAEWGYRVLL
jgi:hypothetical protein